MTGPTGATGSQGLQGEQGPGVLVNEMYLYNYGHGSFAPGEAISFDQPPVPGAFVPGITLIGDDTLELSDVGFYRVDYTFTPKCINTTLALKLNGVEIPGSRYTTHDAPVSIKGTVLFEVAGETPVLLRLVNVNPHQDATLVVGPLHNTVNASLLITGIVAV